MSTAHAVPRTTLCDVLVIDDHRVFADALARAIDAEEDLRCVATARSVAEGLAKASAYDFDAAIIDVRLADGSGLTLLERLRARRPSARLIVLTGHPSSAAAARARACGASAFLAKDGELRDVLSAIRGRGPAGRRPGSGADAQFASAEGPYLTPREQQVLWLMADGCDARAIARALNLSVHTVRDYIKAVLAKFGARSQLDAVVAAARLGVVALGDAAR